MKKINVKKLCICACFISIAFVLNNFFFKVKMPYGGSATFFSMLFIFLPAYFYGGRVGLLCGVAYGLLDLLINPSIVHPAQLFLDYILAFGLIGTGGFLNKSKNGLYTGYTLAISLRFICSAISGAVFFAAYTPEGMNVLVYSILYNGAYIYGEGLITLLLLFVPTVKNSLEMLKKKAA